MATTPIPPLSTVETIADHADYRAKVYRGLLLAAAGILVIGLILALFGRFDERVKYLLQMGSGGSSLIAAIPLAKYLRWSGIRTRCRNLSAVLAAADTPLVTSNAALVRMARTFWKTYDHVGGGR